MDLYPKAQDFNDGLAFCKKRGCEEPYVEYFLDSYLKTGDVKFSKNNAIRLACGITDTNIYNLEFL